MVLLRFPVQYYEISFQLRLTICTSSSFIAPILAIYKTYMLFERINLLLSNVKLKRQMRKSQLLKAK